MLRVRAPQHSDHDVASLLIASMLAVTTYQANQKLNLQCSHTLLGMDQYTSVDLFSGVRSQGQGHS